MNRKTTRLLALILSLVMVISMLPATAMADETTMPLEPAAKDMDDFVSDLELARDTNGNIVFDGNGATYAWTIDTTVNSGDENAPSRFNTNNAQYYLLEDLFGSVTIRNTNFLFTAPEGKVEGNIVGAPSYANNAQLYFMNLGDFTVENCTFNGVILTNFCGEGNTNVVNCGFENVKDAYAIKDIRGKQISVMGNNFTNCGAGVMVSAVADDFQMEIVDISSNMFYNVGLYSNGADRGLVQLAASGVYAENALSYSGNTAMGTNGSTFWQLNQSAVAQVATLVENSNGDYTLAAGSLQPASAYVAYIGEQGYATLEAAIEAANEGDTIDVVASDVTFPALKKKNLTFQTAVGTKVDMNATYAPAEGNTFDGFEFVSRIGFTAANLTLRNCKFTGSNGIYYGCAGGTWTVENCEFTNSVYALQIGESFKHGVDTVDVTVKDCTFTGGFNTYGQDVIIKFENCNFNKGTGYHVFQTWGYMSLTDCTFAADWPTGAQGGHVGIATAEVDATAVTEIYGTTSHLGGATMFDLMEDRSVGTFVVNPEKDTEGKYIAGTFSKAPAAEKLAEGCTATENADGTWTVARKTPAATVGGQEYGSVQDAVEAAKQSGEAVELPATTENSTTIPEAVENVAVTVPVAAGSVTFDAESNVAGATLTMTAAETANEYEITLTGGTINSATVTMPAVDAEKVKVYYLAETGEKNYLDGEFTTVDGTVTFTTTHFSTWGTEVVAQTTTPEYGLDRAYVSWRNANDLQIWGEVTGLAGVYLDQFVVSFYTTDDELVATTTLAQKFTCESSLSWHLRVAGASDEEWWTYDWVDGYPSPEKVPTKATFTINGQNCGSINVEFGHETEAHKTNWADYFVARINNAGEYYTSLQAAINAANADDVVTLVADTTEDMVTVAAGKNVVIDFVGHTLNGSMFVEKGATADIRNGSIVQDDTVAGIEVQGVATLTAMNITSHRHAIRVDGRSTEGTSVTINSGTYTTTVLPEWSAHAVNAGEGSTVLIKGGTFVVDGIEKGGNCVMVKDATTTVTIEGGTFLKATGVEGVICPADGLTITGGTFGTWSYDNYLPEGYWAFQKMDGTFENVDKFFVAEKKDAPSVTPTTIETPTVVTVDGLGDVTLESTYEFVAPHDGEGALESQYSAWHADFVVSVNQDIPANSIVLAGNYGEYGWLGFTNTDPVEAGTKIRLLKDVGNGMMSYYEFCTLVKTFKCGVADINDALDGVNFTVELCMYEIEPCTSENRSWNNEKVNGQVLKANTTNYIIGSAETVVEGTATDVELTGNVIPAEAVTEAAQTVTVTVPVNETESVAVKFAAGAYLADAVLDMENVTGTENHVEGAAATYEITLTRGGEPVELNGTATVTLPLPAGATSAEVWYVVDGVETENMNARVENGKLVFQTPHFSTYIVKTVAWTEPVCASINGGELMTLSAALDAAAAGDTITLTSGATLDFSGWTSVDLNKAIILDGQGATLTGLPEALINGTISAIEIRNLTISGASIAGKYSGHSGVSNAAAFIGVAAHSTAKLTNCHVVDSIIGSDADYYAGGLIGYWGGNATLTIDNCSVTGCTVTAESSVGGMLGHAYDGAAITNSTVGGNTITSTDAEVRPDKSGSVVGRNNGGCTYVDVVETAASTLSPAGTHTQRVIGSIVGGAAVITDGEYFADPTLVEKDTAPTADGKIIQKDGKYVVAKVHDETKGQEDGWYAGITEAVDASATSIELYGNVKEAMATVKVGKSVTIDFNGKTLNGSMMVEKGATADIKNGTIAAPDKLPEPVSGIEVQGVATLTDMNITSYRHAIRVDGLNSDGTKLTINSGNYATLLGMTTGSYYVVNAGEKSHTVINGGVFTGNGGSQGALIVKSDNTVMEIQGGEFHNGDAIVMQIAKATVISGGKYSQWAGSYNNYLAEGYVAVKKGDFYEVIEFTNWLDVADTSWYDAAEPKNAYTINSEEMLAGLAKLVNEGTTFADVTFTLARDLDLSGATYGVTGIVWPGIGLYRTENKPFKGTFNGASKTISGVTFANNGSVEDANTYRGLFNHIEGATVQNLTVNGLGFDSKITGEYGGAMIVGFANGSTISYCVAEGSLTGTHNLAGIVVRIVDTDISNCTNNADLESSYTKIGGIAALSQNSGDYTIENCTNNGEIISTTVAYAGNYPNMPQGSRVDGGIGGIIGWVGYGAPNGRVTIKDCVNTGKITGEIEKNTPVGQIAGQIWTNCTVLGTNKGLTDTLAVDHSPIAGLSFATVKDNEATYVSEITAGNTYLVTASNGFDVGAAPVVTLAPGESISFDQSLVKIGDDKGITAITKVTAETSGELVTYTAAPAVASIGDEIYSTLQDAFNNATAGDTIELLGNVVLNEQVAVLNNLSDITLDGNNYTISIAKDGIDALRFGDGNQKIYSTGVKINDLTITTEEGVTGKYGIFFVGGDLAEGVTNNNVLTNVKIDGAFSYGMVFNSNVGVTMNKCVVKNSNGYGIFTSSDRRSHVVMNDTTVEKLFVNGPNPSHIGIRVIVADGSYVDKYYTPYSDEAGCMPDTSLMTTGTGKVGEVWYNLTNTPTQYVVAEIGGVKYWSLPEAVAAAESGETVTLKADVALKAVNGTSGALTPLVVVDGKTLTLDLAGHTISLMDPDGDKNVTGMPLMLQIKGGADVTINDSSATETTPGTGTIDGECYGNAVYAIVVGAKGETVKSRLTINGGTFKGGATAVQATKGDVVITNGTFDLAETYKSYYPNGTTFMLNCVDNSGSTFSISGGRYYKYNPADNEAEGEYTGFAPGMVGVLSEDGNWYTLVPGNYVARVDGKQYTTLQAAIEAAAAGAKVEVIADTTITETVDLTKSLTLDLGGKAVTLADGVRLGATGESTVLNIENGAINGNRNGVLYLIHEGATLNMDGVTSTNASADTYWGNMVQIGSNVSNSTGFATIKNSTLTCASTAIMVLGTRESGAKDTAVALENTKLNADFGITGNGNCVANLTITNGTITGETIGVYWPGAGKLTVNGDVTGDTAIYVKSGEVEIIGGNITATGEKADFVHLGSGAKATGEAIVVESCGYPNGAATVAINGGTISSANAGALGYYVDSGAGDSVATATVTKSENAIVAAPEGYEWNGEGVLVKVSEETVFYRFTTILFGNELALNFYMTSSSAFVDGENYYAVVTKTYADGRESVVNYIEKNDWGYNGTYFVRAESIAAKEMGDTVTVQIFKGEVGSGTAVSELWTDSVLAYSTRLLNNSTVESEKRYAVDMLNYGAAAQIHFNYNTSNLANASLTSEQKALASAEVEKTNQRTNTVGAYKWTTASFESNIVLNLYYNTEITKATVTYTDHYGKNHSYEMTTENGGIVYDGNNELYKVVVDTLVVGDVDTMVTCKVYSGESELGTTVDSIGSYLARAIAGSTGSEHDLYVEAAKFTATAYAYLHRNDT